MKLVWGGVLFAALLLCSCQKEEIAAGPAVAPGVSFRGVLVVNETGLGLIQGDEVVLDVYEQQNAYSLPNDLIDFQVAGDFGYALCGSTNSLIVFDMKSFLKVDEITGLGDVKQLLVISEQVAFVTAGANDGLVYKIDLINRQIAGVADVGPLTSCIGHSNGKLFVGCGSYFALDRALWVIDPESMQVMEIVPCELCPQDMVTGPDGELWIQFMGYASNAGACDEYDYHAARLAKMNPDSYQMQFFPVFAPTEMYPSHLCLSADGQHLLFVHNGIYEVPVDNPDSKVLISELPVSGIDINPATGDIWFWNSDQNTVGFMDSDGVLKQTYAAGINPVDVAFY